MGEIHVGGAMIIFNNDYARLTRDHEAPGHAHNIYCNGVCWQEVLGASNARRSSTDQDDMPLRYRDYCNEGYKLSNTPYFVHHT